MFSICNIILCRRTLVANKYFGEQHAQQLTVVYTGRTIIRFVFCAPTIYVTFQAHPCDSTAICNLSLNQFQRPTNDFAIRFNWGLLKSSVKVVYEKDKSSEKNHLKNLWRQNIDFDLNLWELIGTIFWRKKLNKQLMSPVSPVFHTVVTMSIGG